MVNIRETEQEKGVVGYLRMVEKSSDKINEHYRKRNQALVEDQLDDFCKVTYGLTFRYDKPLGKCVDTELDDLNDTIKVDKNGKVSADIKYLQFVPLNRDPAKMGLHKPPASRSLNVYQEPGDGTSVGQSGHDFRGNMQNVSQQTHTARGHDPAAAKPEGIWQTSIPEPKKTTKFTIKV